MSVSSRIRSKSIRSIRDSRAITSAAAAGITPIDASARLSVDLLKNGTLKTYPGFSHGMLTVNADVLNADLLAFVEA